MMLHNTFTYHCFSCDVKPDRVSACEQYLHLLKVSSCKEYRIWQLIEILKWYVCMLELTPFFSQDRLMSKGPVIVPRMAFLQLHQQLLLFQVVDHQEDLFIPKKVAIFTLKDI